MEILLFGVRSKCQKCSARFVDRVFGSFAPLWSGTDHKICLTTQNLPEGERGKKPSTQYIYMSKQTNEWSKVNLTLCFVFFQDIFPDKATERKILSFIIKCPSNGCQWTGELRSKTVSSATPCCFYHRDLSVNLM